MESLSVKVGNLMVLLTSTGRFMSNSQLQSRALLTITTLSLKMLILFLLLGLEIVVVNAIKAKHIPLSVIEYREALIEEFQNFAFLDSM